MRKFFTPLLILIYFLILLSFGAIWSYAETDIRLWGIQFFHLALLFGTSVALYYLVRILDPGAKLTISHRIITTLILFLLFDPSSPWWTFVLLRIATEIAERFLRTLFGPVFNPAAFGLLLLSFLGFSSSWWGVSFAPRFPFLGVDISIALFLTLPFAGYVAYKYKKLEIVLTAFVSFALVYTLIFQDFPLFVLLEGTLIFFLLVMAVEPKTSPSTPREKYIYGALVGILAPIFIFYHLSEALILALCIANLYRHRESLQKTFLQ